MRIPIARSSVHGGALSNGEAATHLPDCPRYAKAALECVPPGYNYSHLVGDPVRQTDHRFDAAQFDGLLTDEERTLLRLGMHIAW